MSKSDDNSEKKEFPLKNSLQRNRNIAAIGILSALSIVLLSSPLKIPAPFNLNLIYGLWEIPIIVAFYIYGTKSSVAVSTITFVSLLVIFPGTIPAGPLYNFIAILSMISGLLIVYRISGTKLKFKNNVLLFSLAIITGSLIRIIVMTLVNAVLLPMSPPLGFGIPYNIVVNMLPGIGLFNFSVTVYSIVIARIVVKAVSVNNRIPAKYKV